MAMVAELFLSLLFNVVFYAVGRFVIPIVSLGRARAENAREIVQGRTFIYDHRDGKVTISEFFTSAIGVIATIALGVLTYQLTHH